MFNRFRNCSTIKQKIRASESSCDTYCDIYSLTVTVLSKKPVAPIERTVSVSSDVSQTSQASTQSTINTATTTASSGSAAATTGAARSKKPLKRQSLLPPSTSSAKQGTYTCVSMLCTLTLQYGARKVEGMRQWPA